MTRSVKFTVDDLDNFPDDGKRREVIEGELYVSPSPTRHHQRILRRLVVAVGNYLEQNSVGEVFFAPFDVRFSLSDGVQPDLLYISNERAQIIGEKYVDGAPDWVVEILSPNNRSYDLQTKRRLYQKYGVKVYWVVDPLEQKVFVWEEGEEEATIFSSSEKVAVSILPGLSFSVAKLVAP